jgi:hypothetical protein
MIMRVISEVFYSLSEKYNFIFIGAPGHFANEENSTPEVKRRYKKNATVTPQPHSNTTVRRGATNRVNSDNSNFLSLQSQVVRR